MTYLATNPLFHGISPETLSRDFDGIISHLRMFRKGDILAKLFFMSVKTIRQKLASYLLRMLKQQGDSPIQLDRSQQELADYFGVSRPSLARELAHMQDDGLIKTDRKLVHILRKEDMMQLIQ